MPTLGIRQEPTAPATPVAEIPDRHQRPGVIITGSCSDSAFVAAKVLICADTLSAEEAIRVWLEIHGIRWAADSGFADRSRTRVSQPSTNSVEPPSASTPTALRGHRGNRSSHPMSARTCRRCRKRTDRARRLLSVTRANGSEQILLHRVSLVAAGGRGRLPPMAGPPPVAADRQAGHGARQRDGRGSDRSASRPCHPASYPLGKPRNTWGSATTSYSIFARPEPFDRCPSRVCGNSCSTSGSWTTWLSGGEPDLTRPRPDSLKCPVVEAPEMARPVWA